MNIARSDSTHSLLVKRDVVQDAEISFAVNLDILETYYW